MDVTVFEDEIKQCCIECQIEETVAYWDQELECYIYLRETPYCLGCEPKSKQKSISA